MSDSVHRQGTCDFARATKLSKLSATALLSASSAEAPALLVCALPRGHLVLAAARSKRRGGSPGAAIGKVTAACGRAALDMPGEVER